LEHTRSIPQTVLFAVFALHRSDNVRGPSQFTEWACEQRLRRPGTFDPDYSTVAFTASSLLVQRGSDPPPQTVICYLDLLDRTDISWSS
jgi:hypothetical protein